MRGEMARYPDARFSRRAFVRISAFWSAAILTGAGSGCAALRKESYHQAGEARMITIQSRDGTPIACRKSGSGPPLLLVHGTTADHTRWTSVAPAFEDKFTVFAVDRRGRGESGDTDPYAIQREFEDVAAVIDSITGPVNVLGHSYGAICCLEAVLLAKNVRKLILYEPPIPTGIQIYPPGAPERIQALVDEGDREGAVATFFREIVRMPEKELEMLRSLPVWKSRVASAHTIAREMTFDKHYKFLPERFSGLDVPTLLLLGGDSPPFLRKAIEAVHSALPDSRIVEMPGQQHTAMNTAPALFAAEVLRFLLE